MDLFSRIKKNNAYARVASEGLISDIKWYIPTGSFLFNALLSGSLFGGMAGNKIIGFAGPPSSGKTLLTISVLKNYLAMSPYHKVIYFDTEGAIDKQMLLDLKIDLQRFMHVPLKKLEDLKNQYIQILDLIIKDRGENSLNNPEKFFFVVDSLGMMTTDKEVSDSLEDKNAADMGLRAKLIKSIFRLSTMDLAFLQYPCIITSHTYDSMEKYKPSGISGGKGLIFSASFVIELFPSKDKEGTEVVGIIMTATARKSRFTKQWRKVQIGLSFNNGIDPYYGLLDFGVENGVITKEGRKFVFPDGNKHFKDDIEKNPEKVFTQDVLIALDVAAKKYFCYGQEEITVETQPVKEELKDIEPTVQDKIIKTVDSEDIEEIDEILAESGGILADEDI